MWTSLEIVKLIISLGTPFVIAILGFFLNRHLKQIDQKNEEHRLREREAKERERDEKERRYALRIEFMVDALFLGPQKGFYLAEFVTTIHNKSLIRHKFTKINLTIRGIENDEDIGLWTMELGDRKVDTGKICFPIKILKENIIPPQWNYIFVEPDVEQKLTYLTPIPENIRFIVAKIEFHYDASTPHTAEKMFELKAS